MFDDGLFLKMFAGAFVLFAGSMLVGAYLVFVLYWPLPRVGGAIFKGIGALGRMWGIYSGHNTWDFLRRSHSASGQVVEIKILERSGNGPSSTVYKAPVIRFETAEGVSSTFLGMASTSVNRSVGEQVDVVYDPGKPEHVRIDSFWELWFLTVLFLSGSTLFLGAARLDPLN